MWVGLGWGGLCSLGLICGWGEGEGSVLMCLGYWCNVVRVFWAGGGGGVGSGHEDQGAQLGSYENFVQHLGIPVDDLGSVLTVGCKPC